MAHVWANLLEVRTWLMNLDDAQLELVIFDCDGVLVDSEHIANSTLVGLLAEIGVEMTVQESFDMFRGRTLSNAFEIVESRFGKRVPEGLADQFYSRMDVAFRRDLKPVPGVVEALDKISLPMCVASNGPHHMMQTTLGVTGLLERFEGRIFSAVDVGRGKPFPDLFLHAAERMRANPEQCVVVEDAVTGVQAAVAARMSVLGYADHSTQELLERAGATVFNDMAELPALLGM